MKILKLHLAACLLLISFQIFADSASIYFNGDILTMEGELQKQAMGWAKVSLWLTAGGVGLVSIATPYFSPEIMSKWFVMPNILWLSPIPLLTAALFFLVLKSISALQSGSSKKEWVPFVSVVAIFLAIFFWNCVQYFSVCHCRKNDLMGSSGSN